MQKKKIIIFAAIFIIIAGVSGWFIYRDFKDTSETGPISENNQTPENKSLEDLMQEGKIKVEVESVSPSSEMSAEEIKKRVPNLDREIIVTASLDEETKSRAIKSIKEIVAQLKQDYDRREDWLNLGIWRKTIGDYEGARQVWEFVALIRPTDAVPLHNLGDLYAQYLSNFSLAEKYYLAAIAKEPTTAFFYMKLHEFYRYFVKKPDLAENILVKGIKATNNDPSLEKILADYRKEIGK